MFRRIGGERRAVTNAGLLRNVSSSRAPRILKLLNRSFGRWRAGSTADAGRLLRFLKLLQQSIQFQSHAADLISAINFQALGNIRAGADAADRRAEPLQPSQDQP